MLSKEDLQAIAAIMDEKINTAVEASEKRMLEKIDEVRNDIAAVKEDVADLKEDIATVKEDTAITRVSANALVEWTEKVSPIVEVPFLKEVK